MADFRKCLLAFAVIAILAGLAVPANAQSTAALQCTFNASVTPTVRAEGLSELVGDIVLNCTGGTPTPVNQPVPAANITVFMSQNITSRITASPFTEVLMIMDEPHSASHPATPLVPCTANLGVCSILGTGSGAGTYDGTTGRPNVFQARTLSTGVSGLTNQVTFIGVPIDPPGTSGTRIIRITNLRANANALGVSSTAVPSQITAYLSVNPPSLLPLNNPQQTVAFVSRGLIPATVDTATTFIQCSGANSNAVSDITKIVTPAAGQNGYQFSVVLDEGFASAWKEKNIAQHIANTPTTSSGVTTVGVNYPADATQDIPGANYFSETGFLVNGTAPTGAAPSGYGPFETTLGIAANTAFTSTNGLSSAGVANAGTRLMFAFNNVPNGVKVAVPRAIFLTNQSGGATTGVAVLTTTDTAGAGAYSGATGAQFLTLSTGTTGNTGSAVYEVLYTEPFVLERISLPVGVVYAANVSNDLPQPLLTSTVTASFAPLSSVTTMSSSAPIPRFAQSQTPVNAFNIVRCTCNMLFPFVSNQAGFDTGIAIANTSSDPYGTPGQSGTVTLNYYSAGTPPTPQTTTSVVPAGQILTFTLSGGGNFGIGPTAGFQGYIIAQSNFQYCHGFAYLSAAGQPYSGEGYLGIILDNGTLNRTKQAGEVQAH